MGRGVGQGNSTSSAVRSATVMPFCSRVGEKEVLNDYEGGASGRQTLRRENSSGNRPCNVSFPGMTCTGPGSLWVH